LTDLRRGQAHVWTLPVNQDDAAAIERLRGVLSDEEKARCAGISDAGNQREYLAAHILAHLMLAHFSTIAAADWHFLAGPHGRPEPAPEINSMALRFNLSHATGMVACALTTQDDIGLDVEWLERSNRLDAIAEQKFAVSEAATFASAAEDRRQQVFFSFWTLKESYIKAIGKGLREPLNGFAFELEPLGISFLNGQDAADCWSFDLFQPSPHHLAALSLAHPAGATVEITRRHFGWDELVAL